MTKTAFIGTMMLCCAVLWGVVVVVVVVVVFVQGVVCVGPDFITNRQELIFNHSHRLSGKELSSCSLLIKLLVGEQEWSNAADDRSSRLWKTRTGGRRNNKNSSTREIVITSSPFC
jgi:hypothetical protein